MKLRTTLTAIGVALPTALAAGAAGAAPLMDEAAADPRFDTFTQAVEAAGLTETLNSGDVTVFAPTDEAFAMMPQGELEALLEPENRDKLKAVLSYHVVPGTVTSDEARQKSGLNPETVQGEAVRIDATGGGLLYEDAQVVYRDIQTDNGLIHGIDRVVTPDNG
jgi:uncharacterized surface protein with fasciclin (FAS1) repeats